LLVLHEGEAAIFCGDESTWDGSPIALVLGERSGVPCGVGAPPRAAPDIVSVRARSGSADNPQSTVRVLSPRSGWILNDRPSLVWSEISGASSYTVTLLGDDGIARPPIVAPQAWLAYPEEWESIQGDGASYRLQVEGAGEVTDVATPGFSLLPPIEKEALNAKESHLRTRPFHEVGLTLLLAHLYLSYDLRSEAVEVLNALPNASEFVAVQELLGDTYLEMGLVAEAQSAYTLMLQRAKSSGIVEAQAAAQVGSGHVACVQLNAEMAESSWQQALALYTDIGLDDLVREVDALLAGLAVNCEQGGTSTP
jgi:hypothetical protein